MSDEMVRVHVDMDVLVENMNEAQEIARLVEGFIGALRACGWRTRGQATAFTRDEQSVERASDEADVRAADALLGRALQNLAEQVGAVPSGAGKGKAS